MKKKNKMENYGIGATIRIGGEIHCPPCAGFFGTFLAVPFQVFLVCKLVVVKRVDHNYSLK